MQSILLCASEIAEIIRVFSALDMVVLLSDGKSRDFGIFSLIGWHLTPIRQPSGPRVLIESFSPSIKLLVVVYIRRAIFTFANHHSTTHSDFHIDSP